jgi:translation initiation factor 2 gamma subunit (eIF-2gamma)
MQTQTAECLVIGEITCPKILVVLNKVDLLPPDKKDAMIEKVIRLTLTGTVWTGYPLVPLPLFLEKKPNSFSLLCILCILYILSLKIH